MRPGPGRGWVRSTEGAKEEGARRTSGWAYGGGEEMRAYLDGGRGLVERRVELEGIAEDVLVERREEHAVVDVQADEQHTYTRGEAQGLWLALVRSWGR